MTYQNGHGDSVWDEQSETLREIRECSIYTVTPIIYFKRGVTSVDKVPRTVSHNTVPVVKNKFQKLLPYNHATRRRKGHRRLSGVRRVIRSNPSRHSKKVRTAEC